MIAMIKGGKVVRVRDTEVEAYKELGYIPHVKQPDKAKPPVEKQEPKPTK